MAKPNWCTPTPSSGSGNGTVNVSGTAHTGRVKRSGVLTYKAAGVADVTQSVVQNAKPEFVTVNNVSAPKGGGNVTITGKSNSSKLNFALGSGDLPITLPNTYTAGGASTANNANIAGDPGATAEFDFAMTISVPANGTINPRTRIINVTATGGQSVSLTITQAAGDPTLSITPTEITLDESGSAESVSVTSNTNWTVE